MTITTVNRKAGPYLSDGVQTVYPFSFRIFEPEDIVVTVGPKDPPEPVEGEEPQPTSWTLTYGEDYTVSFVDGDEVGSITLTSPVEVDMLVVITSDVPALQLTHLTNKGGMFAEVLETAYDRAVVLIQQLDEKVDRAIKVGVTSSSSADDYKAELETVAKQAAASASAAAASAQEASEDAQQAVSDASTALSQSTTAINDSAIALAQSTTAINDSASALETATSANNLATTADSNASDALEKAEQALAETTEIDTKVSDAVNDAIAGIEIPGLTLETITGALGYTPYDGETNALGFASESAITDAVAPIGEELDALEPRVATNETDIDNLEASVLTKSQITNCITEIPQDIKLELADGTLTLKAGSKVYVPNGFESDGTTPKFDAVTIANDLSLGTVGSYTGSGLLYCSAQGTYLTQPIASASGTTPLSNGAWYDTSSNLIKLYGAGSDSGERVSFPIARVHRASGTWDGIDQVFNGFGYIGNTVFALPNVKGLIPNGRNADGTLNNIEITVSRVAISLSSTLPLNSYDLVFSTTGITPSSLTEYDVNRNINYDRNTGTKSNACKSGKVLCENGNIVGLSDIQPFRAVDWNEFDALEERVTTAEGNITDVTTRVDAIEEGGVGGSSRNVGELVHSRLPLTDAGLHLLDGTLLTVGGAYDEFITHVAGLQTDHPQIFVTEEEWQTSVTNYGSCDKFVYTEGVSLRLPKSQSLHGSLVWSSKQGQQWCRIYEDGWCEQGGFIAGGTGSTGTITFIKPFIKSADGDFVVVSNAENNAGSHTFIVNQTGSGESVNWYKSTAAIGGDWVAYGYVDISDLQTAPIYEYIVVATSTKTDIQIDIDNALTDLANKADRDLTNTVPSQSFINQAINWMKPDYDSQITVTTFPYTVPSDGWLFGDGGGTASASGKMFINGVRIAREAGDVYSIQVMVFSGDVITVDYDAGLTFMPMKKGS